MLREESHIREIGFRKFRLYGRILDVVSFKVRYSGSGRSRKKTVDKKFITVSEDGKSTKNYSWPINVWDSEINFEVLELPDGSTPVSKDGRSNQDGENNVSGESGRGDLSDGNKRAVESA